MKTKTRKKPSYRFMALGLFSSVPLSVFLGATPAQAQMGIEDDIANESAAGARTRLQYTDYTFKSGDFRMLLTPALSMQFNDNINCTESGKLCDFIVLPTMGVLMSYPLTTENVLELNLTGGYNEYCIHPQFSSWYLAAGSGLSFDVHIKDILVNLHDQFSYVQNSSQNADVAGTGTYGTFENTVGLSVKCDNLKNIPITVGYDHQNTIATSSQFSDNNCSTETGYARVGYDLNSKFTAGVEGSASYTAYDQNTLNDNESYSVGVYVDWHPDAFLNVEPRVGYVIDQFQQTSQQIQTSNLHSWYADLNVAHQITRSLNYSLDVGRNVNPGVQSDVSEYWYVNTGINWNFIKYFSFQPRLFFQHGTQGAGSTLTAAGMANTSLVSTENYNWYGGNIGFGYDITRRFTVNWNYTFTQRTSNVSNRGYTQNLVGIQITYHTI